MKILSYFIALSNLLCIEVLEGEMLTFDSKENGKVGRYQVV